MAWPNSKSVSYFRNFVIGCDYNTSFIYSENDFLIFRNDLFNIFETHFRIFGISFSKQNRTRLSVIQIIVL